MSSARYVSAWLHEQKEFCVIDLKEKTLINGFFCSIKVTQTIAKYLNNPDNAVSDLEDTLNAIECAFGADKMIEMFKNYKSSKPNV